MAAKEDWAGHALKLNEVAAFEFRAFWRMLATSSVGMGEPGCHSV